MAGELGVIISEHQQIENWTSPAFDALGERLEEIEIYGEPEPGDFEAGEKGVPLQTFAGNTGSATRPTITGA